MRVFVCNFQNNMLASRLLNGSVAGAERAGAQAVFFWIVNEFVHRTRSPTVIAISSKILFFSYIIMLCLTDVREAAQIYNAFLFKTRKQHFRLHQSAAAALNNLAQLFYDNSVK